MLTFDQILHIGEFIITVAGFIVAYYVFFLQAKTFSAQQEISILENKKFLFQIKPIFEIADFKNKTVVGGLVSYNLNIILRDNIAMNFTITNNSDAGISELFQERSLKYVNVNLQFPVFDGYLSSNLQDDECRIILYFEDEVGTKYKQEIFGATRNPQISPCLLQ